MDLCSKFFGPANVVGLLRQQSEGFEMNIEHKLEPIEHWIVDGKAYRLATENDVGKECLRSDTDIGLAMGNTRRELVAFRDGEEYPYIFGTKWRYAYIQDDSLLTPPEPTPTTKPIDWTKPVRTKSRHPVRILCTDGPRANYPVIGIIQDTTDVLSWTLDGTHSDGHSSDLDLENAPQRIQREYWVNVYDDLHISKLHETKDDAIRMRAPLQTCRACVKITIDCEEGEGL